LALFSLSESQGPPACLRCVLLISLSFSPLACPEPRGATHHSPLLFPLTPIIPTHTSDSAASPIIPPHTQNMGVGVFSTGRISPIRSRPIPAIYYYIYSYTNNIGADIFHIPFQSAFKRRFPLSTFYLPTLLTAFLPAPYYGYRFIQLNSHSRCCLGIRSSPDRCGLLGDEF
jgi:hypothetical protein